MRLSTIVAIASALLALEGCSSDDTATNKGSSTPDASSADTSTGDTGTPDTGSDTSSNDTGADDGGGGDGGGGDASDGACPAAWLDVPSVDPSLTPDAGSVILHAAGSGTQNYVCEQIADGGFSWTFTGPDAVLYDCNAAMIGHHFASDAGAAPEWQTTDGTYVIGHKLAAFTPDGGAASVPWLLLAGAAHGGSGTLSNAQYIQRLYTDGGIAPSTSCDGTTVNTTAQQPYSADYYFYGP